MISWRLLFPENVEPHDLLRASATWGVLWFCEAMLTLGTEGRVKSFLYFSTTVTIFKLVT